MGGPGITCRDVVRKRFDPRFLQPRCRIKRLAPFVGEHHKLCPAMMRVGLELDKPVSGQVIDDALHVLAICSQIPGEPCHRLRMVRRNDGAQNLPACAGQSQLRHKPIARHKHLIVETEQVEDEVRHRIAGRSLIIIHLTP